MPPEGSVLVTALCFSAAARHPAQQSCLSQAGSSLWWVSHKDQLQPVSAQMAGSSPPKDLTPHYNPISVLHDTPSGSMTIGSQHDNDQRDP